MREMYGVIEKKGSVVPEMDNTFIISVMDKRAPDHMLITSNLDLDSLLNR